jgi:glycerol-3-phosphate acyltransferase PlsX
MVNSSGETGRIAVDAMGGDLGPAEVVEAVKLALRPVSRAQPVTLVGDESSFCHWWPRPVSMTGQGRSGAPRLRSHHDGGQAARRPPPKKKDASMVRAIELVKEGEAGVVVSCGNTGALMAGGTLKPAHHGGRRPPRPRRDHPARKRPFRPDRRRRQSRGQARAPVHNAILGSHYCPVVLGIPKPRVGLITIGTEEGKGNALTTETHELLKRASASSTTPAPSKASRSSLSTCDVVVCDGFTGNIMLKSWESLAKFISTILRDELFKANPMRSHRRPSRASGAFNALKERINPERYGGAPLLGLAATCSRPTARATATPSRAPSTPPAMSSRRT